MALEDAERCFEDGAWRQLIHPPDVAVRHLRAAVVDSRVEQMIRHGRPLPSGLRVPDGRRNEHCRVYAADGRFVGLVNFNPSARQWQPHRVFSLSYPLPEDTPGAVIP
jgi:tRNA U55 pseudouridine synthase TruB